MMVIGGRIDSWIQSIDFSFGGTLRFDDYVGPEFRFNAEYLDLGCQEFNLSQYIFGLAKNHQNSLQGKRDILMSRRLATAKQPRLDWLRQSSVHDRCRILRDLTHSRRRDEPATSLPTG
jgi:hypothetical protein